MKENFKKYYLILLTMSTSSSLIADTLDFMGNTTNEEPYEQCGYCHEYDGNSIMPSFPILAGQQSAYIIKQLQDFRSGKRHGKMQATAELLTDGDILIVAKYFSQQTVLSNKLNKLTSSQKQLAKQIFYNGDVTRGLQSCVSCHGQSALGIGNIPRLAGQHENYLYEQLLLFKSGGRKNDENNQMQLISGLLNQHEMKVLVSFLSSLIAPQNRVSSTIK